MNPFISLTYDDGELRIREENITAVVATSEGTHIYIIASEEPFGVVETVDEVMSLCAIARGGSHAVD